MTRRAFTPLGPRANRKRISRRARHRAALKAWRAKVAALKAKAKGADLTIEQASVEEQVAKVDLDFSQLPLGPDTTGGK
jgi:hypothetical protein